MEVLAPLSADLVQWLNEAQAQVDGDLQIDPVLCPNVGMIAHGEEGGRQGVLIATTSGWVCPHCGHHTSEVRFHPLRASIQLLMTIRSDDMPCGALLERLNLRLQAYSHLLTQQKPGAAEMVSALLRRRLPFLRAASEVHVSPALEDSLC